MKAIIRALIGFLALSVCLVLAAPSAAARTTPAAPGAVTAATRVARYRAVHPSGGRTIRRAWPRLTSPRGDDGDKHPGRSSTPGRQARSRVAGCRHHQT